MLTARSQAENYARALPASEIAAGRPPFVLVADVGNVIEVYAEFTRSGASYTPFPDPRSHRIALNDLARPEIRERLRLVWTKWATADFIVGNPPFNGASTMRSALGDGYVEALRHLWKEVPDSADFVMYWWSRAASAVLSGGARQFGFITTNSLTMIYNRRVVQAAMKPRR